MRIALRLVPVLLMTAAACNTNAPVAPVAQPNAQQTDVAAAPEEESTVAEDDTATAAAEPTMQVASWQETMDLVAQHQGKVVVLDMWASW